LPYSLSFCLKLIRTLPASAGDEHRALHAWFYHWLEAAEPKLAQFVHDQADPKPFTVSPLTAEGDERSHFRVTLLEDDYWQYIERGMARERTNRVLDRILALDGPPQVTHKTYIELAQSTATRREVILRFDSPTSFKSREKHYPLPDPMLVFESHHARWNAFAPDALKIDEAWSEWLANTVAVSRFELSSQVVDFGSYQQIGCVGKAQYMTVGNGPDLAAGLGPFNALADYAFFCGTGHKTTQGMGQTRRLERWEPS
jgi:CRISPR-associated endoribonuclease Cas6